jgi:hypothetical protein
MEEETHEVKVLGRIVGVASGWDQVDDWSIVLYDFVPSKQPGQRTTLEIGHLTVNYEEGKFQYFNDDNGELDYEQDMIGVLMTIY